MDELGQAEVGSEPGGEAGSEMEPDIVELSLATLAGRIQSSALPVPLQNPTLLPLKDLDPEVLERLAAEIVSRQDNRGVQFYGRRGQAQYGLDIVELESSRSRSLYQVKRYQEITPGEIRAAIEDYAGTPRPATSEDAPRRFDPRRLVLVTSASVDSDTGNVEEIARLQDAYRDDLDLEVWGAETLSRKLRDAPHLVLAVFGAAWAKAFCGFEPAPPVAGAPRPLALIEADHSARARDDGG